MSASKKLAALKAPPAPPPGVAPKSEPAPVVVVSNTLGIQRVENGFLLEVGLTGGDAGFRERRKMVAKNAAELAGIVTNWAVDGNAPKKR